MIVQGETRLGALWKNCVCLRASASITLPNMVLLCQVWRSFAHIQQHDTRNIAEDVWEICGGSSSVQSEQRVLS